MKTEIYKDSKGEFRWHSKDEKGNIIAASSEGFLTTHECELNISHTLTATLEYMLLKWLNIDHHP